MLLSLFSLVAFSRPGLHFLAPRDGAAIAEGTALLVALETSGGFRVPIDGVVHLAVLREDSDVPLFEQTLEGIAPFDLSSAPLGDLVLHATLRAPGGVVAESIVKVAIVEQRRAVERRSYRRQEGFRLIYAGGHWSDAGGGSGQGSTLPMTAALRALLFDLVPALGVRSFLDAGCGAMHWQPLVLERLQRQAGHHVAYRGVDIVPELIERHRVTFAHQPSWSFANEDLAQEQRAAGPESLPQPSYDLVMCKDVLFHNTNEAVLSILHRVSTSGSAYLLATSNVDPGGSGALNANRTALGTDGRAMELGGFRPLDLEQAPFGLPRPEVMLLVASADGTSPPDIFIGLWSLPLPPRPAVRTTPLLPLVEVTIAVAGAAAHFSLRPDEDGRPWSTRLVFCTPPTAPALECVRATWHHVDAGIDVLRLHGEEEALVEEVGKRPAPPRITSAPAVALQSLLTEIARGDDVWLLDANPAQDGGLFAAFASTVDRRIAVAALLVGSAAQVHPPQLVRDMVNAGLLASRSTLATRASSAWGTVPDLLRARREGMPLALRARVHLQPDEELAKLVGHHVTLEDLLSEFGAARPRCILVQLESEHLDGTAVVNAAALLGIHAAHYDGTATMDEAGSSVVELVFRLPASKLQPHTTAAVAANAGSEAFVCTMSGAESQPLRIGVTVAGVHLLHLLETTYRQLCPTRSVIVATVGSFMPTQKLHVIVIQAIDGGCSDGWDWYCQTEARKVIEAHPDALHILWVGEPWEMSAAVSVAESGVFKDVTLVHTRRDDCTLTCVYIPVVSVSFAHRALHTVNDLNSPSRATTAAAAPAQKFAAYMYARCDGLARPRRERFFDLLSKYKRVDALGSCKSESRARFVRSERRHRSDYLDRAVEAFEGYRFVIAFENQDAEGYVSEKLANAMLAGSVAIYAGAPDVGTLFNPRSFIDCSALDLISCVELVRDVDMNETRYQKMLAEPRLAHGQLALPFSWDARHPEHATPRGFPAQLGHALHLQHQSRQGGEPSSALAKVGIERPSRHARLPTTTVVIRAFLEVLPGGGEDFIDKYGDSARVCFGLYSTDHPEHALQELRMELWVATITMRDVQPGDYELRAWLESASGGTLSATTTTPFAVIAPPSAGGVLPRPSSSQLALEREVTAAVPFLDEFTPSPSSSDVFARRHNCAADARRRRALVVGIKVAAWMFSTRAAIRETWMRRGREKGVDAVVWFIIGQPNTNANVDVARLEAEAEAHGDMLLASDVNVTDSYITLVQKSVTFMVWASRRYDFNHMIITDADVFMRLDVVAKALATAPRERFLLGQVWKEQFRRRIRPVREADMRNYLPTSVYPMDELPPFAYGGHYVVTPDCVDFIVRNRYDLRGVGDLEDVSVSFWLLSIGVHAEHAPLFGDAHSTQCTDTLASFAGINDDAMRAMHANLEAGAPLCRGFSQGDWVRRVKLTRDHDGT